MRSKTRIGDRLDVYEVAPTKPTPTEAVGVVTCVADCEEQATWRVLDLYYCDSHLPEADIQSAEWLGIDIVTTS